MFCIKGKAMSNSAMSNETDLDWLARNVHVWKSGYDLAVVQRGIEEIYVTWPSACSSGITKKEWLSRRAELQNKPSWDDFGESAKFMAQDSDGAWMAFESEPAANYHVWSSMRGWCGYAREGRDRCRGEVLGDWRDTLEKRPEQLKPSIEEANRLAQEFNPFTSIEDNQDREGVNQKLNELEMLGKVSHLISDKRHRITTSKYTKTIHGVPVDVYDVLQAWGVINPALQHLIKKALQCGQRGHKDNAQDLQDIIDSAIRAKELG